MTRFWSSPFGLIAVALAALIIVGLAFYADASALAWVAAHRTPAVLAFMEKVSRWGDWPAHVALGIILAVVAYMRGNRRWLRIFLAMLLACALAGIAARAIKIGTGRARPAVQTEARWNGPRLDASYNAFPSGHTASSTAFFATLAFVSWRRGGAFLVVSILIGFSRIYVGAHHLSDVVCAALLGLVTAWLVSRSHLLLVTIPQHAIDK